MQQKILKLERLRNMKMKTSSNSSTIQRKMRTRSLIQLGGLLEHSKTLEVFNIPLEIDLQKDPSVKNNIAALFKSFIIINDMVTSKELDLDVLALQGLQAFKDNGLPESRPLDRKKYQGFEAYSERDLLDESANDNARLSRIRSSSSQVGKAEEQNSIIGEGVKM